MSIGTEEPATTGRYLIVFTDSVVGDDDAAREVVASVTGRRHMRSTRDAPERALSTAALAADDGVLFSDLGVAIVAVPADRIGVAGFTPDDDRILAVEPERVMHAFGTRDEVAANAVGAADAAAFVDDAVATWGLHATGVLEGPETGEGVTIAVLDTGIDLRHPDVVDRDGPEVETRSFVRGETVQDAQGHGTHCAGTAAGPRTPSSGRRYGVAPRARLMVGKVLSDEGTGTDTDILAGMSWAIGAGAHVISMSLGADQRTISTAYETVGRRALEAGTLIIAAAGNNASRADGDPGFVGVPANSPSILAVGAIDASLQVADFSASATDIAGGEVDIAAPGVAVYSSWPLPDRVDTISGTSMATPHVAGLAALWAQRTGATGQELWDAVVGTARALPHPVADVGTGLATAPAAVDET